MAADGVRRALAFVTSAYSTYSGCRQYRENIAAAQEEVGPAAPQVDKLRVFFNHPGFIEPMVESVRQCLDRFPADRARSRDDAVHRPQHPAGDGRRTAATRRSSRSVPTGRRRRRPRAAGSSSTKAAAARRSSRGSSPTCATASSSCTPRASCTELLIVPIGFISDHMEVLYDLDTEARDLCDRLGIRMERAATVGTHPRFVRMIRELIVERMIGLAERAGTGRAWPQPRCVSRRLLPLHSHAAPRGIRHETVSERLVLAFSRLRRSCGCSAETKEKAKEAVQETGEAARATGEAAVSATKDAADAVSDAAERTKDSLDRNDSSDANK